MIFGRKYRQVFHNICPIYPFMPGTVVEPCTSRTAFQVHTNRKVDLEDAAGMFKPFVNTPHLLIYNIDGAEIHLFPVGRMLVRKVESAEEALSKAKTLYEKLGLTLE